MRLRPAGLPGMTEHTADLVREWVEVSCEEQGVPVKVEDAGVIDAVVLLLGGAFPAGGQTRQVGEKRDGSKRL